MADLGSMAYFLQKRRGILDKQDEMKQQIGLYLLKSQLENKAKQDQMMQNLRLIQSLSGGQGQPTQPIPSFAQGLRPTPISPVSLKGTLEEPQIGLKSPEDTQKEQFQQNIQRWQTAQNIPAPNVGLVRQNPDIIRRALLARGVRNQLQPKFGGRSFVQEASGQYKESPTAQKTKLQAIVNMEGKNSNQIQMEVKKSDPAYFNYLKAIYEGRDVPKYSRYGDQNQIHMDVNTLWPDFDASLQPTRVAARKGFATGKEAQNIRSLNTAVQHLDALNSLIPQLQNSGFRPGNTLKNWISVNTGKPAVTRFNMVKQALSGELATIFKNTGGTDTEIRNISMSIDASNSPQQLQAVVEEAVALMAGRMSALDSQWKGIFGQDSKSPNPIVNSKSQKILDKLGLSNYVSGNETLDNKTVLPQGKYGKYTYTIE